jgi:hypothetical protein
VRLIFGRGAPACNVNSTKINTAINVARAMAMMARKILLIAGNVGMVVSFGPSCGRLTPAVEVRLRAIPPIPISAGLAPVPSA